jgi:hypothetical protein
MRIDVVDRSTWRARPKRDLANREDHVQGDVKKAPSCEGAFAIRQRARQSRGLRAFFRPLFAAVFETSVAAAALASMAVAEHATPSKPSQKMRSEITTGVTVSVAVAADALLPPFVWSAPAAIVFT